MKKNTGTRTTKIILIIFGVILIGAIWAVSVRVLVPLNEFADSEGKLRVIYNKIINESGSGVSGATFKKTCSRSYGGFIVTGYSCGQTGDVTLKNDIGKQVAVQNIERSVAGSGLTSDQGVTIDDNGVHLDFDATSHGIKCYILYGMETLNNTWGYSLGCSKETDGGLPGYLSE